MENSAETAHEVTFDQAFGNALKQQKTAAKDELDKTVESPEGETQPEETPEELQAQENEETPDAPEESVDQPEQLISDEEFAKLDQDPAKLRKELNRAFTQKTQKLAAERKQNAEILERFERYKDFIDAFEEDPRGTLSQVAKQFGIEIPSKQDVPEKADTPSKDESVGSRAAEILTAQLGPEYSGFAEKLATAIDTLVNERLASVETKIEGRIKPIEARDLAAETRQELETFTTKRPDWKKYEKEMVALGKKVQPAEGTTTVEYLDFLYRTVTAGAGKGDKVSQIVKKINKVSSNSENPDTGVPRGRVVSTPREPDLTQAFQMALRGELVED